MRTRSRRIFHGRFGMSVEIDELPLGRVAQAGRSQAVGVLSSEKQLTENEKVAS